MDKIIVPFNLYIISEVLERKPDIKTLDLSKNDPLILTLETTLVTELKTSIRSIFQGFSIFIIAPIDVAKNLSLILKTSQIVLKEDTI